MKQLLILSGKGGTGKTTIASAFIKLADAKAFADCDVDAPNLHLVLEPFPKEKISDYYGLDKAVIDPDRCTNCGICFDACRFNAIVQEDGQHTVDAIACEGCTLCAYLCPEKAITMVKTKAGELKLYSNDSSHFSTATLSMGSGTTGLLVTQVKNQLKDVALQTEFAIIDGSPGIGCPVIASLTGADLALIVAEPSISGISDMKRIILTAAKLGVAVAVCVNKSDTNDELSAKVESFCWKEGIYFVGKIPFDPMAVKAVNEGKTVIDYACISGTAVRDVYAKTVQMLKETIRR
ncbi:MAG TPA: ATP-binding protein [Sphaerochaeta sp.]|nr:ATP-binding protein [Sphaerochaeta sp.]